MKEGGTLEEQRIESVTKDNKSPVPVGIFASDDYAWLSAVIFGSNAMWGKVRALSSDPNPNIFFQAVKRNLSDDMPIEKALVVVSFSRLGGPFKPDVRSAAACPYRRLSGANAFEISDIDRMNIVVYEITIRQGQDGERNANVQELSEASDQAIQKHDLALKDSLSGISQ